MVGFGLVPVTPGLHSPALRTGITQHTGVMWGLVTGQVEESDGE